MTPDEQLLLWKNGNSVHNDLPNIKGGECCPDFSCCVPELLAPQDVRDAFCNASQDERESMLMGFLEKMLRHHYGENNISSISIKTKLGIQKTFSVKHTAIKPPVKVFEKKNYCVPTFENRIPRFKCTHENAGSSKCRFFKIDKMYGSLACFWLHGEGLCLSNGARNDAVIKMREKNE